MIHPKNKKVTLLGKKSKLSDSLSEINTKKVVSFQQEGINKISIVGTTFVTPYVLIQSHGDIQCKDESCISKIPDATFVPSRKAIQSADLSKQVINTFLSSHEGFLDKDAFKKGDKKFSPSHFKDVKNVKIGYLKKDFSVQIDGKNLLVDQFLIDSTVVDSLAVNKEKSSVDVRLKNADCSVRKDSMTTPSPTVMYCSKNATTEDAYNLKMYLATYKEQLQAARGLQLGNFSDRIKLTSSFPSCRTNGKLVCCHDGDEEEMCY